MEWQHGGSIEGEAGSGGGGLQLLSRILMISTGWWRHGCWMRGRVSIVVIVPMDGHGRVKRLCRNPRTIVQVKVLIDTAASEVNTSTTQESL